MALSTTGLVVTAALVAGAAGAGAAVAVVECSRTSSAAPAGDSERLVALEDRIAKQDREIGELRARLDEAAHGRMPGVGRTPPGYPGGPPGDAPGGVVEGRPPLPGPGGPAETQDLLGSVTPEERERFEAVYRQLREKEQEQARKGRQVAYEQQLRGRLDRLPQNLALSAEQKDAVVRILMERGEKLRAAFAEVGPAGGPDARKAAQEKAEAIRQETRTLLEQALTVDQAKAVENLADREGAGGQVRGVRPGVRRVEPGGQPGGGRRRPGGDGAEPPQQPEQPPR